MKKFLFCFIALMLLFSSIIINIKTDQKLNNTENKYLNIYEPYMTELTSNSITNSITELKTELKSIKYINRPISGGAYYLLAIKNNGELFFWGDNSFFGKGYIESPAQAVKIMDDIKSALGEQYLPLVIDKNDNLWAWGQFGEYLTNLLMKIV